MSSSHAKIILSLTAVIWALASSAYPATQPDPRTADCDAKRLTLKQSIVGTPNFQALKKKIQMILAGMTHEEIDSLSQMITVRQSATASGGALSQTYEAIVDLYRKGVEKAGLKFGSPNADLIPGSSLYITVSGSAEKKDEIPALDARALDPASFQAPSPAPSSVIGVGILASPFLHRFPVELILGAPTAVGSPLFPFLDDQLKSECAGVPSALDPQETGTVSATDPS